jgi:hypothetical protein
MEYAKMLVMVQKASKDNTGVFLRPRFRLCGVRRPLFASGERPPRDRFVKAYARANLPIKTVPATADGRQVLIEGTCTAM